MNFREVPQLLERYKEKAQGKKIIWYCTGGIRCEKAAVLANKSGIADIYAIEGGVVKYVNKYNDGNWLGNLYTFDGRVSTQVGDEKTHTTIGTCLHSGKLTDNCDNCRHTPCNARMIVDSKEHKKHLGFCSQECFDAAQKDLLIKDVDWDAIRINNKSCTYKELRSLVKNDRIALQEAQDLVAKHFQKILGKIPFLHQESQKEGVIEMD
ncbi:MAG: rhodanese-like domain-containing protein [bacterium]